MPKRRVLVLIALALGGLAAANGLFLSLMLGGRREVLARPYANAEMQATVDALLASRVIRLESGAVTVDEGRLAAEVPRVATRTQIRRLLPFVRAEADGRLVLDTRAVEVRYQAVPGGVERGPIWDRQGEVLARSLTDARTRKSTREYPLGPAAFHVIGASHAAFGDRGIEAAYREELVRGDGVTLTLSARLQRTAMEVLGARPGAAVVLAVPSGEILALASAPSFDPGERRAEAWLGAERDREARPFTSRALASLYPPGSLFKVVDLAAWLESPAREPSLALTCKGQSHAYRIRDTHAHGPVTAEPAFARSCNIFFAEVGVRLGPALKATAERFGFNGPLAVLPESRRGLAVAASQAFAWRDRDGVRQYRPSDFRHNPRIVAQSAIGQNLVHATPLQMALVAATIAADGTRPAPVLVRGTGPAPLFDAHRPGAGTPVVRPETARAMARMMTAVMTEGTGKALPRLWRVGERVQVGGTPVGGATAIAVAGKTGTAEVGLDPRANRPHAWFIGFAPADRPEVAVAVLIEHGGAGAEVAGPVAMSLLARGLEVLWTPLDARTATPWNRSGGSKS